MASVSLQSRLTLNCKLSGRTKSGSALTVGIVPALRSGKPAPSGGRKIFFDDFSGDETRTGVQRTPPLGAVKIAFAIFTGDKTRTGVRSMPRPA